ncbi:MAG: dTDP-4-dehydrorhamnose reductase [Acidobacteria bacterium]|nr:dTDP-4-dehydrorhamnose reductase [Acidobacteriota bacterium]
MKGRIFLTGAAGRLGATFAEACAGRDLVAHARTTLDITDPRMVGKAIADAAPGVVINCAAFNDVDGAEQRPTEALAANAFAVRSLARAAEAVGATLVHLSTDFVFDGTATEAYREDDETSPRSTYASSKLLGEWFACEAPGAYVLRVESLFGAPGGWQGRPGSLDAILDGLERGAEVKAFTDRIVSPSYVHDVASAVLHLLETRAPAGVYHCVNSGQATWYEVAEESARLLGVAPRLRPITMETAGLKASRPRFCALANQKLADAGFPMPTWHDSLRRWLTVRSASKARMDASHHG